MSDLKDLQSKVAKFRDDRNWRKFHTPKDLSMTIAIESAELMECFQWEAKEHLDLVKSSEAGEEMADVLINLLNLADVLDIDLIKETNKKITKIVKKYPVEKSKGSCKKYTEL